MTTFCVDDTIAAVASAPGASVRGIVRLSGPQILDCLGRCFREQPAALAQPDDLCAADGLTDAPPGTGGPPAAPRAHHGRAVEHRLVTSLASIRYPTRVRGWLSAGLPWPPIPCDLYYWPTNRSYTRQPSAELHTIGSPPLLGAVLRTLCAHGARLAQPGEFTLRAFLGGRIDLTRAEAVLGVVNATNQQQLTKALHQLAGGLAQPLGQIQTQLLDLCADLEAGLDFVDQDIAFISNEQLLARLTEIGSTLLRLRQQMSDRSEGNHEPYVVLWGPPNVGKSSLWNALVDDGRALVSEWAGTTRDYLVGTCHAGGFTVRLVDTAGIDPQGSWSAIDQSAQQAALQWRQRADLILICLESGRAATMWEHEQIRALETTRFLIVRTKVDRHPLGQDATDNRTATRDQRPWPCDDSLLAGSRESVPAVETSALTGLGLDRLRHAIATLLEQADEEPGLFVGHTAERCKNSLSAAIACIDRAAEAARIGLGEELVAAEIRLALDEIGRIVGTVYTDDILDRIFSRFCVGK